MKDEFTRLYETYHHSLFRYIFYMVRDKEAAEELVQDVYIKVLQSHSSFKGDSSEKTWLYSVARHTAIDWVRMQNRKKRKWFGLLGPLSQEEVEDPAPLPDEIISARDDIREVYRAMEDCTPDQRHVLILRYMESLTVKETASTLGWSESKVKTTQHRALKKLRDLMRENGEDSERRVNG
ncbi:RNA polymerase sigma factor SigX [Bacillus piscicola]|uniref:RNA polymerase sigma factor SigX n=1 Tax=Bacillus piscicola TaxID=1632684 RepID=UPI001F091881